MPELPRPPSVAAELERALGDPLDDERPGSFRGSVGADRAGRFPQELCTAAFEWGLAEHLVPEECGGRFRSIEECFALARVLSRRDLTATVAIGASLLASLPVWLRGTSEQKHRVADLLRTGKFLSFALSESEHGADVLAGEVSARREPPGWRLDGTKWLINNAGHASGATVAARTGTGVRGLTLFLVTRTAADCGRWTPLPKVDTHGLRGSAFGGMTFAGFTARDTDVIGRPGRGLETVLQTLQVTRVLVAGFALGALDTCLAATVSFARARRLYDAPIVELEPVARRLVDAWTELAIGETVALSACRAVQLAPDQLPLLSACAKYLVPQLAIDSIESLSVVLGARSYVADGHWHGIFEKMRRDCAVTALFDGSAPVTLDAIVGQLPALGLSRAGGCVDAVPPAVSLPPPAALPWVDAVDFELGTDSDAVHRGIAAARTVIRREQRRIPHGRLLLELLDWCEAETARVDAEVRRSATDADWRRSGAAFDLAARYTHLHAAGACCWRWLTERDRSADGFVAGGGWLVSCLRRLARRSGLEQPPLDDVDRAALRRLQHAHDEQFPESGRPERRRRPEEVEAP